MPALAAMVHALGRFGAGPHQRLRRRARGTRARRLSQARHAARATSPFTTSRPTNRGAAITARSSSRATRRPRLAVIDWDYNAWGWKYPPFDDDDDGADANRRAARSADLHARHGARGRLDRREWHRHTAHHEILSAQSQPQSRSLAEAEIEQRLCDYLGVKTILWLGDGIEGDDTDGHIDDLTRFVAASTVVTVVEEDENDANYRAAPGQSRTASRR